MDSAGTTHTTQLQLLEAAHLLSRGGLVAFPTETVYGLGADAENELAVRRIFAVKGRPSAHPLIVHLPPGTPLEEYASFVPDAARRLAERFWPGPLTLVLRRRPGRVRDAVTGGLETVALRVPSHPVALSLLDAFGRGLAAPSANRFGRLSPTTAAHVHEDLGDAVDLVLDGGPCRVGIESTIVDLSGVEGGPAILRPGGVPREAIEAALGGGVAVPVQECSDAGAGGAVRSPGQHAAHYAPSAGVVLVEGAEVRSRALSLRAEGRRVAVLAAKRGPIPDGMQWLAPPASHEELARTLYATLRELDRSGVDVVVVERPAAEGLGLAVCDRLRRAAAATAVAAGAAR